MSSGTKERPTAREAMRKQALRWWHFAHYRGRQFVRGIPVDFLPLMPHWRSWPREHREADARAGVNVGLLAFPQSIAYSLIAGLPPQFGLISSSMGAIVAPLFSRSRFIVPGPTNASAILLFAGLSAAGIAVAERPTVVPLFVLMVGAFQVLGSLLRVEQILAYISRSVVTGYITAAAALIIANQVQNMLGYRVSGASTFFAVLSGTLRHLGDTRWPELMMSVTTLTAYLALRRFAPRLPNVAGTLALTAGLGFAYRWLGWDLSYLSGFSLRHLNPLQAHFDFELVGQLAMPALALAFVSVLEGGSVGRSLAARAGERLNVSQEIYGLGLANIASAFLGGMGVSGSLTRSVLNCTSGARTAYSTIVGGGVVFVLLFTVGWLISFIPTAALATLVICIAVPLFNGHHIATALNTTRSDAIVFTVTFGSALLFKLDTAIYLGAFTSLVLFLKKVGTPELAEYQFNTEGQLAEKTASQRRNTPGISILHAEGDLFFGATEIFVSQMREVIADPSLRIVILRLKNARHLDATCVLAIEELMEFLRADGRHLLVSGADHEVQRVFRNSGLLHRLGHENFFPEVPGNPTVATRSALKRAQELLGGQKAEVRIFVDRKPQPAAEG